MEEIKLRVSGIEKSFPGVKALNNINFAVRKGTVHALCGENGAGKSTLMKVLTGLYKADKGQIFIDEKPVEIKNPIQAREYGISMIEQELVRRGRLEKGAPRSQKVSGGRKAEL